MSLLTENDIIHNQNFNYVFFLVINESCIIFGTSDQGAPIMSIQSDYGYDIKNELFLKWKIVEITW